MEIKDILTKAIEEAALSAIRDGVFPEAELPNIVLEVPPKKELGDFAAWRSKDRAAFCATAGNQVGLSYALWRYGAGDADGKAAVLLC